MFLSETPPAAASEQTARLSPQLARLRCRTSVSHPVISTCMLSQAPVSRPHTNQLGPLPSAAQHRRAVACAWVLNGLGAVPGLKRLGTLSCCSTPRRKLPHVPESRPAPHLTQLARQLPRVRTLGLHARRQRRGRGCRSLLHFMAAPSTILCQQYGRQPVPAPHIASTVTVSSASSAQAPATYVELLCRTCAESGLTLTGPVRGSCLPSKLIIRWACLATSAPPVAWRCLAISCSSCAILSSS